MNRFLSALIFLLWTACLGRCLAEQYGVLGNEAIQCCANEQDCGQDGPQKDNSPGKGSPCVVCDYVTHGGVTLIQPLLLAAVCLLVLSVVALCAPRLVEMVRRTATVSYEVDTGPPRIWRLCEYLARTGTPVRGPAVMA